MTPFIVFGFQATMFFPVLPQYQYRSLYIKSIILYLLLIFYFCQRAYYPSLLSNSVSLSTNRAGEEHVLRTILMRHSVKMKASFHFSLARINKKAETFFVSAFSNQAVNPQKAVLEVNEPFWVLLPLLSF